jgi:hypothetical protein
VIEQQGHGRRPTGERGAALQEAQRQEEGNRVDPEIGEVEQPAGREAGDDERLAATEAIGERPPEWREEEIGHHLDGEEERCIGDRAAELVDHQLLQTGDDQRQVEHGHEEAEAGERHCASLPGRLERDGAGFRGGGAGDCGRKGGHSGGLPRIGRREILPRGGAG